MQIYINIAEQEIKWLYESDDSLLFSLLAFWILYSYLNNVEVDGAGTKRPYTIYDF